MIMNSYIKSQVANMIAMLNTFEASCEFAAKMDDSVVDRDEEKTLKRIKKATKIFRDELEKL